MIQKDEKPFHFKIQKNFQKNLYQIGVQNDEKNELYHLILLGNS